jgi:hypothetical protein
MQPSPPSEGAGSRPRATKGKTFPIDPKGSFFTKSIPCFCMSLKFLWGCKISCGAICTPFGSQNYMFGHIKKFGFGPVPIPVRNSIQKRITIKFLLNIFNTLF